MPRRNAALVLDQALLYVRNNCTQETACAAEATTAYEGVDPAVWAPTTPYSLGAAVRPVARNNFVYEATVGGTSGGTQPTFPTTPGATVVDGGVTWTCRTNHVVAVATMAPSDFTVAAGLSGGNTPRRLIVAARTGTPIVRNGTADHVALVRPGSATVPPELFYVTVSTPQALTAGGTVTIPTFDAEIRAVGAP